MDQIDWNAELRKIMREFEGLPPEPSPEELRRQYEAERAERARREAATTVRGMVARVSLVLVLAAALPLWPYAARCGAGLAAHLGAIAMLAAGGSWAAACAWQRRMPKSYTVSLLALLWALALAAQQVLPRTGYAAHAGYPATWRCSTSRRTPVRASVRPSRAVPPNCDPASLRAAYPLRTRLDPLETLDHLGSRRRTCGADPSTAQTGLASVALDRRAHPDRDHPLAHPG